MNRNSGKIDSGIGPGHYNTTHTFWKLKHGCIGKQKRDLGHSSQKITPGFYDIPSAIPNIAKYNYPAWEDRKIRY